MLIKHYETHVWTHLQPRARLRCILKLLHLLSCLMTLNIHPANGTLSSLDKLPWQMRTVDESVSVSDAVSFVDNLMKICEARRAAVYSLHTDTHDLPSTHSPVLDDDADTVESLLLLLLLLPSLTWLLRQFQVQASLRTNVRLR